MASKRRELKSEVEFNRDFEDLFVAGLSQDSKSGGMGSDGADLRSPIIIIKKRSKAKGGALTWFGQGNSIYVWDKKRESYVIANVQIYVRVSGSKGLPAGKAKRSDDDLIANADIVE